MFWNTGIMEIDKNLFWYFYMVKFIGQIHSRDGNSSKTGFRTSVNAGRNDFLDGQLVENYPSTNSSGPGPLPDLYFDSFSYPVTPIVSSAGRVV